MAFAPFDGVLLDDPRDPIPGAVAVQLHLRTERRLALQDGRPSLGPRALVDRAAACRALLGQGLLPDQVRALGRFGLALGSPRDPASPASLVRHLEAYLEAVEGSGWLEPMAVLWRAAGAQAGGGRGFWIERHPEDGPLAAGLEELAPPNLRALCALPGLGTVCFALATRRGAGRGGLFEGQEPHLVRLLLPGLEELAAGPGLAHFELETPAGWADAPWGEALDRLFEGPLALDESARAVLRRAELPTEAAVWRAAVEQTRTWVASGIPPSAITLVHPDPGLLGPLLAPLLAAEGLPFRGHPGPSLADAPTWGPLRSLLAGLRDGDPAALAAGLGASLRPTPLGRALRALAARLDRVDQAGQGPLEAAFAALRDGDRAWLRDRWAFLLELPGRLQTPGLWLGDLEALAQRLELMEEAAFYPALGLLREAWDPDPAPMAFPEFLEALEATLAVLRAPDAPGDPAGLRLVSPADLAHRWPGAEATLILDLGDGVWPGAPVANPDLDWPRLVALNAALRAMDAAGEGAPDFPPRLQAFPLPQSEAGETLPRAFHGPAYGFNRLLALTRREVVALSAARDAGGQRRAQGPFWRALDGAGTWTPDPLRAASDLRWRWEAGQADELTAARQAALRPAPAGPGVPAARPAPEADRMPGLWDHGDSVERPLSPTLLEGLARCPFRVHAERHLGLESWDADATHPLNLGTLAHHLMEDLLQGVVGEAHWPAAFLARHGLAAPAAAPLMGLLKARWAAEGEGWLAALRQVTATELQRLRLGMAELLPALADLLAGDLSQGGPTKDELAALGLEPGSEWRRELVGLEHRLEPRALALPGGGAVWVKGTLDRLERLVCGDRAFLRILDYKTSGTAALKAYADDDGAFGAHLQLPLYQAMLAAETGLPVTALLVPLKDGWKPVPMMLQGADRERMLANVGALLEGARRGDFPASPGAHCDTCPFSALCGRPVDVDGAAAESGEEEAP